MAVMYGGEPLSTEEVPQFHPSVLGPSLYTLGNIRYRIGDKSITIYSFEDNSSDEDAHSEDEDIQDIDTDCESDMYRCVRRAHLEVCLPPGTLENRGKIIELNDDSTPKYPDSSQAEAAGGSGDVAPGPSSKPQLLFPAYDEPVTSSSTSTWIAKCGPPAPPAPPVLPPPPVPPLAYWLARSSGSAPRDAVLVGRDLDGGPLYVGRACVYGELLPGKVATHHRVCYVASEGRELAFEKYEVLTLKRGRVEWVRGRNGSFPFDAFPAGLTLQNQRVYVARARVNDILTPGRFVVGEKECRISYNMKEYKFNDYEILTVRSLEPGDLGLVRYVSAEHLYVSEHYQKRFRPEGWCGTNLSDEMDDYPDLEEDEDDDDDDDDEYVNENVNENVEEEEDDDDDEFEMEEEEGGVQVLQLLPDDQVIFIE